MKKHLLQALSLSLLAVVFFAGCGSTINNAPLNAVSPVFSTQPATESTVEVNSTLSLSVAANVSDDGTLSYQWYSSNSSSNEGGTAINDATSASYTVPTSTTGTYYFYCVIINTIADNGDGGTKTASSTSAVAKVTVKPVTVNAATPTFSTNLSGSITIAVNSSTTLSVVAATTDDGTLTYQWYANTANSNVGGTVISEGTKSSYSVKPTVEGTTYYYCVVTNTINDNGDGGTKTAKATSNIASVIGTVTNAMAPSITTQPESATLPAESGQTHSFTVQASTTDNGTISYQWYSNTVETTSGGTLISNETTASYNASISTVGTYYYYCEITNTIPDNQDGGTKKATLTSNVATLIVQTTAGVTITIPSAKAISITGTKTVSKGTALSLSATTGFSTYTWYFDGIKQTGSSSSFSLDTSSLSAGIHTVTVAAYEESGAGCSATVNVKINN